MGEEEKKKKTESPSAPAVEQNKTDDRSEEDPSPSPEIVLRVYMHCEGCARKIQKCLNGFPGVENVKTDMRINQVIVKGEKADPSKVLERVQKKCNREVELISPLPAPPPEEETPEKPVEKEERTENKNEEPPVITAVLGVYMHCDACAQEIRRRILKMKGVESVVADLNSSKVTVKGKFSPEILVDSIFRRTAKHATIISVEPEKKEEEKSNEKPDNEEKKKNDDGGDPPAEKDEEESKIENGIHYFHPPNLQIYTHTAFTEEYPPQVFSDENPNACTVA